MKKQLLIFLFLFLRSAPALSSLSVTPYFVTFQAASKHHSELVRIMNNSKTTNTYRIRLINYRQNEDGSYSKIEEPLPSCPFADKYLNLSPRETTLEPNEAQTIRIQRKSMATAPDGEYVSHLWIQELPAQNLNAGQRAGGQELTVRIKALYGVTIPIIIEKGDLFSKGEITAAELTEVDQKPYAKVSINRKGNKSFLGDIILYENDEEIGRINEFRIHLSTPVRTLLIPLKRKPLFPVKILLKYAGTDEIISYKEF